MKCEGGVSDVFPANSDVRKTCVHAFTPFTSFSWTGYCAESWTRAIAERVSVMSLSPRLTLLSNLRGVTGGGSGDGPRGTALGDEMTEP